MSLPHPPGDSTASTTGPQGHTRRATASVSIIIVNFNGAEDVIRCLGSLAQHDYDSYEVIVVDNASIDDSVSRIRAQFPDVKLIASQENLGFGGGNNRGAAEATGEFLAFINPDTTVEPDWLRPLVSALQEDPTAGIATTRLLMMAPPHPINAAGNYVHFTGFGYLRGWNQPADALMQRDEIFAISGAAFMMRRTLYEELGGFDLIFYPAYVEDIDLAWRVRLAGYRVIYVPESVVYHDYTLTFHTGKYSMLERHRQQMLVKNYRWATLLVLLPGLLLAEVVTWGYALLSGPAHLRAKFASYSWFFKRWGAVMAARRRTQQMRRVPDRAILKHTTHRLAYSQANTGLAAKIGTYVIDPIFYVLHRFSLFVIRW
ncbi:MAG: glycosyltransferase family 2 protein [Chloroflexota bacterium]